MKNHFSRFGKTLVATLILLGTQSVNAQCVQAVSNTTSTNIAIFSSASVTNPDLAYDNSDGDITTKATLSISGIATATLNVNFDERANQGDSIIIMFGAPSSSLGLGTTTFTPYSGTNGTGTASAAYSSGTFSVILTVGSVSLGRISVPVTTSLGAQSITISLSGISLTTTNYIYDAAIKPGPLTATNPTAICYNTSATLSASYNALVAQPIDVLWYDSDGTTLLQITSNKSGAPYTNTFVTPALTATKTYYVRECWNGCTLLSDPKAITVTVLPQITPAISVNCAATTKLTTTTTNATAPINYLWTASAGGNISAGAGTATATITKVGTYNVQITDGNGCVGTSSRTINVVDCGILPVRFLSFNASTKDAGILLEWITATESSIVGFDVECSADGTSWSRIGFVPSTPINNNISNNYFWLHKTPFAGDNFYRLKAIETNAGYIFSETRSAKAKNTVEKLEVFPNPVNHDLNITLPSPATINTVVTIYNNDGRLVYTKSIAAMRFVTVPTYNLGAGIYYLAIKEKGILLYHTTFLKR